jgi:hypothetical protein
VGKPGDEAETQQLLLMKEELDRRARGAGISPAEGDE